MSIKIGWDNQQQTVLRYDFVGVWSWTEFETAVEQAFGMIESVFHTVDIIMNFESSQKTPDDILSYLKLKLSTLPINCGVIVVIGSCKRLQASLDMLTRIYRQMSKSLIRAKNVLEARKLIVEARASRTNKTRMSVS